jgi:hypothetical protein
MFLENPNIGERKKKWGTDNSLGEMKTTPQFPLLVF